MRSNERYILTGMRVLQGEWLTGQAVVIENTKVKAIVPNNMIEHHQPAKKIELSAQDMLVPGFIDLHIHGARGSDVMDATAESFKTISNALAEEGVTGYLATTMTASQQAIEAVLAAIPTAMQEQHGAAILGVHLEGPFIAADKRGAQRDDAIIAPDSNLLNAWQTLAQGAIKMVTMAPELPGALTFIETLRAANIIAAIGHTNATYDQTMQAIQAGCHHATHLFNAMRGIHQRDAGATGAILLSDGVSADVIVDGIHLQPAIVDLIYRLKGHERLMLISDAMRAKCLCDGKYDLGGQEVLVIKSKAVLRDGTLAGSVLKLPDAIKNIVQYTGCTLEQALRMASYNPARKLNIESHKGSIEVGKDADLVVLSSELDVKMTMREGLIVFTTL